MHVPPTHIRHTHKKNNMGKLRRAPIWKEKLWLVREYSNSRKPNQSKASSFLRLHFSSWQFSHRKANTHTYPCTWESQELHSPKHHSPVYEMKRGHTGTLHTHTMYFSFIVLVVVVIGFFWTPSTESSYSYSFQSSWSPVIWGRPLAFLSLFPFGPAFSPPLQEAILMGLIHIFHV